MISSIDMYKFGSSLRRNYFVETRFEFRRVRIRKDKQPRTHRGLQCLANSRPIAQRQPQIGGGQHGKWKTIVRGVREHELE